MLEQNIDLVDFCALLIEEIDLLKSELDEERIKSILDVRHECEQVINSVRDCILLTGFSGGDFQFSNGISLFFPWSLSSYESAKYDYEKLQFIKEEDAGKKWNQFLQKYLSGVTFRNSRSITETENNGKLQGASVVYESYSNMSRILDSIDSDWDDPQILGEDKQPPNSGKQPPNSGRQPPNSGRQPPNSGRQPPNSGRMIDDMSIFLYRFMKLKNFEFNWNRTGFTSKHVTFSSQTSATRPVAGRIEIDIPKPRTIQDRIQRLLDKLNAFSANNKENTNILNYLNLLMRILNDSDEPTIVEILNDLEASDAASSEDQLFTSLKRAIDLSATDNATKVKFKTDLEKLNLQNN